MNKSRRVLRRMGYLHDQQGIMNRYLREGSGWSGHLEHTRSFITGSFSSSWPDSLAILGSGWLLDVPVEELAGRCKRIILVDINHPPQIRRKVKEMAQVELLEKDLTGGLAGQLYRLVRTRSIRNEEELLAALRPGEPLGDLEADAWVSVNLLNQLDIILSDFLVKKGYFQQIPPDGFRTMIQSHHLEWLTRRPGCLITDVRERNLARDGTESSKTLLYTDLPQGIRQEEWIWEFDTFGTYRHRCRTLMEVKAVEWAT